jgi:hypothetical protein
LHLSHLASIFIGFFDEEGHNSLVFIGDCGFHGHHFLLGIMRKWSVLASFHIIAPLWPYFFQVFSHFVNIGPILARISAVLPRCRDNAFPTCAKFKLG